MNFPDDIRIDFSSRFDHTCTTSLYNVRDEEVIKPWPANVIIGEKVFSVRIGPTGGKRGYTPITGHPSWGIAWWLNDKLIPEVYVERGQTYTFVVEGGNDRTNPARYHPFYITDSKEGGFGQKREDQQRRQRVFAGVSYDAEGYPYPTAGKYKRELPKDNFDLFSKLFKLKKYSPLSSRTLLRMGS